MAAAFELTRPERKGEFEVTVYQVGWRLGGKGASGRGPGGRIEEHGLHLWMGFYENAFRLMRDCYAELGRKKGSCPIVDWTDAFVPDPSCGVMDRDPAGRWRPWISHFPPQDGLPGDGATDGARRSWTPADYMARSLRLLMTLLDAVRVQSGEAATAAATDGPATPPLSRQDLERNIARLLRYGQLATLGAVIEALRLLDVAVQALPGLPTEAILRFHDMLSSGARRQIEALADRDDEVRRLWEIVELVLAVVRGMIRFGLLTDARGFEAIDHYDCREWLRMNGASERAVNGAFLRALYDLAFAYEDGDPERPRIAAGQALRGSMRAFFTYRGAFFWKMRAGMGDVVFAPFYEVLRRRGVRFEFFHRLERLRIAGGGRGGGAPHVAALEMDVQARVAGGKAYAPLVDVKDLPCWPSSPRWEQLVDGDRLRLDGVDFESRWERRRVGKKTLTVSRDFDFVVLAVGLGEVAHVCRDLVEDDLRWRRMVAEVKSVPTQAFQIWMHEEMSELGWNGEPTNISGFVEPFDTWADMRQLIPREAFAQRVSSIAYFCSVLPDAGAREAASPDYPRRRRDEVRRNAVAFLNEDVRHLWPNAQRDEGGFRWDLLVDPSASRHARRGRTARASRRGGRAADSARFDSQFWTANVNPSDRYSLSLPGTLRHRISPLDRTYDNFTIAGDWTDCGFNEGCVEAAVMSGRLAAHALAGRPALSDIVGFDHP